MPTLHMGLHGVLGEHQHGVPEHGHHHQDGTEAHHHVEDGAHDDHGELEREHPDRPADHGKNSLAHRDLAAEQSPPSIPPIPEALLAAEQPSPLTLRSLRIERRLQAQKARGPPSLTTFLS